MAENPPVIYLLHGEDELAISQEITKIQNKLGDPSMIEINTTRLDGRVVSLDEVATVVGTLPFMAKRRLVILTHPIARLNSPASRQKFLSILEKTPDSTALLLIEYQKLTEDRDRKKNKLHWLEKWAADAGSRVYARVYPVPQGSALTARVQEMAKAAGGQITPQAAGLLVSLVGDHLPALQQEINKLVAYTNYQRPVEDEDVEHLTGDRMHGDIFVLVDAVGSFDGKRAVDMLHRLLDEQEPISIFAMVIRQFRLILQAREVLDSGGSAGDVTRLLRLHPFVAEKVTGQAQRFSMALLVDIYHRLLDIDVAIKTGEMDGALALDTFIVSIAQTA